MKKRAIVVIIILFFGILGIKTYNNFMDGFTSIPNSIENYCEIKYNSSGFKFKRFTDKSTVDSKVAVVEKGGKDFRVERYYDGNRKVHYKDNYQGVLYSAEISAMIRSKLPSHDTTIFKNELSSFPESMDGAVPVEQVLRDEKTMISIYVKSKDIWDEERIHGLVENLKGICRVDVDLCDANSIWVFTTGSDFSLAQINRLEKR